MAKCHTIKIKNAGFENIYSNSDFEFVMQWDAIYVIIGIVITVGMLCGIIALCVNISDRVRITSGQLIHAIREPWRMPLDNGFKYFLIAMEENKIEGGHTRHAAPFLDRMNEVATYWQIGALNERDIQEFFGRDITNLKNNAYLQDILKHYYEKNSSYDNLKKLLEKSNQWG